MKQDQEQFNMKMLMEAGKTIGEGVSGYIDKKTAAAAKENQAKGWYGAMHDNAEGYSKATGLPVDTVRGIAASGMNQKGDALIGRYMNDQGFFDNAFKANMVNTQMAGAGQRQQAGFNNTKEQNATKPTNIPVRIGNIIQD